MLCGGPFFRNLMKFTLVFMSVNFEILR